MDKYKEITNDWKYYASCMLTSLVVSDLSELNEHISIKADSECTVQCNLSTMEDFINANV
jgi:hypothetical protein